MRPFVFMPPFHHFVEFIHDKVVQNQKLIPIDNTYEG